MKRIRRAHVLPLMLIGLVLALGMRVTWVASQTETGWNVLGVQWRDATLGWFGWGHRPVQDRVPAEQAEFWLAEVERVLAANPESAELAMGAAWVLDSPGRGFQYEVATDPDVRESPWFPLARDLARTEVRWETVIRLEDEFEEKCSQRCLELARRATELDPENNDWWRMRALLLFRWSRFGERFGPREADWREVLAEAARHDPQNALYDYLAAIALWEGHGRREFSPETGDRIEIINVAGFEEGNDCFARGLAKRTLQIGEKSRPAVLRFLGRTGLSRAEQAEIASDRLLEARGANLLDGLRIWQRARSDELQQARDFRGAVNAWDRFLKTIDQVAAAEDRGAVARLVYPFRVFALGQITGLAGESLDAIEQERRPDLKARFADAQGKNTSMLQARISVETTDAIQLLAKFVAAPRLSAAMLLLSLGGLGLLWSASSGRKDSLPRVDFGPVRHAVAWTIGFALTVGVVAVLAVKPLPRFGWLPAEALTRAFGLHGYVGRFVLNWMVFPTQYLGAGLALIVVSLWYVIRATENSPRALERFVRRGSAAQWRGLLGCVSRSAVGLGVCLLLMYLLAAPDALRVEENDFQRTIAPIRDPAAYWSGIEQRAAAIEAGRLPP